MLDTAGDYQIVQEFLIESYENPEHLDRELVILESNPAAPKLLPVSFARFT